MLELEDPWVVLVVEVLVGDQLDLAARLGTDQRGTWLLPDDCPVVRVAYPERRRPGLVAKLSVPLPLWMSTCLHAGRLDPVTGPQPAIRGRTGDVYSSYLTVRKRSAASRPRSLVSARTAGPTGREGVSQGPL